MLGIDLAVSGRFPLGIPRGWFQLLWSEELEAGQAVPLRNFGEDFVAWRDLNGGVHVADAYCPHLGAHLGYGEVGEAGLKCPFHGWTFDSSGRLANIPYGTKMPFRGQLRSLPVLEANGHILAWFDPDGNEPRWEAPTVPEVGTEQFGKYFRTETIRVRSVCQELAENFVDVNHVGHLHGLPPIEELEVAENGPIRQLSLVESIPSPFGPIKIRATLECSGLSYFVLWFRSSVDMCSVTSIVPVDERAVDVRFSWLSRRKNGRVLSPRVADTVVDDMLRVFREDMKIWETKMYLDRPRLASEDYRIASFREWASQFYSNLS